MQEPVASASPRLLVAVGSSYDCKEENRYRLSDEIILSRGCAIVAFLIPIRLSLTYVILIPLMLWWIYRRGPRTLLSVHDADFVAGFRNSLLLPLALFIGSVVFSSTLGIQPLNSVRPLISLCFFSSSFLLFAHFGKPVLVAGALLAGQSVAAIHSIADSAFPNILPQLFVGRVTESGQLAISILIACGVIASLARRIATHADLQPWIKRHAYGLGIGTILLTLLGFRDHLGINTLGALLILGALLTSLVLGYRSTQGKPPECRAWWLVTLVASPLMVTALLVNLKRGPLLGVAIALFVFLRGLSPRISNFFLVCIAAFLVSVTPVRERIGASWEHFTITGGRSTIWRIGAELTARFPTGIGFHNSPILRDFAPEIPENLKHFHNNILNIVAENGWLSLGLFFWFICSTLTLCFKDRTDHLRVGLGCAILAWQIAGLVEYNFGDSEVLLLVWAILGTMFGVNGRLRIEQTPN